ncbi:formate--tetrahydrofolate ligase [Photobacterium atrarenae]|uniref:Formate--tetrahydrofolate ligase n=1 Tax=Photobacterium atrarenae TaxID=865757 RepID=A0ABY5GJM2_9GAMM|nr:formate--tetrahydrofolate ligase [Photobacterium atrarenae]UTV29510.1 formate--tetrahydrofolate ligase [Photobacterium atrarenae]
MKNEMNIALIPPDNIPPPGATDLEIARAVTPKPVIEIAAERLGLLPHQLIPYGHYKAKVDLMQLDVSQPRGKLVLVTAMTPTPAGEGKTTTSIGLCDGLNALGINTSVCLREPSLGPCFGMKGGAAGGGRAQAIPMEDLNLHFNGDFHAVTVAHNLLVSLIDNHLHWGNELALDPRQISWRRVMDLNERALRNIVCGLGGTAHGIPRESGFDITVASEIMAVLCLAEDLHDLQLRLSAMVIGRRRDGSVVTAGELGADGALTVLLKDAMMPNLIQSLEHNPVLVHGGPFANIAHGCSSLMATRTALALTDVVITEAGFGADLGAEKFLDIKCRLSGLAPDAVVLVCTIRALKMQGGIAKADLALPDVVAVEAGSVNLLRHIRNVQQFGLTPLVVVNRFPTDSDEELAVIQRCGLASGVRVVSAEHWARGSDGAQALALAVQEQLSAPKPELTLLYPDEMPLDEKIYTVATRMYGAGEVQYSSAAYRQLEEIHQLGFGHLPVCIAKTPYSFSSEPAILGAPVNHTLPVRELRLMAGAGFVVAVCGDIMTMPGLPRHPAALNIRLDERGEIIGLC